MEKIDTKSLFRNLVQLLIFCILVYATSAFSNASGISLITNISLLEMLGFYYGIATASLWYFAIMHLRLNFIFKELLLLLFFVLIPYISMLAWGTTIAQVLGNNLSVVEGIMLIFSILIILFIVTLMPFLKDQDGEQPVKVKNDYSMFPVVAINLLIVLTTAMYFVEFRWYLIIAWIGFFLGLLLLNRFNKKHAISMISLEMAAYVLGVCITFCFLG